MADTLTSAQNPLRVMIVDDSAIVRGFLTRALEKDPEIRIVTTAANGAMALQSIQRFDVEVILLDVEMPEMDGLTALPQLLKARPDVRIIMVSTLTKENAAISIRALAMGASDYIEKPTSRTETGNIDVFNKELLQKIKVLGTAVRKKNYRPGAPSPVSAPARSIPTSPVPSLPSAHAAPIYKSSSAPQPALKLRPPMKSSLAAIAIACSTGGPQALAVLFQGLKNQLPHIPIFITQHMPPTFTTFLAEHISKVSGKSCVEGAEGDAVTAGKIYLAPGDFHMEAHKENGEVRIRINKNPPENFCRPAADPMIRSLIPIYGKNLLIVVLTGMGHDGLEGARKATSQDATVIAQNEETSVVWGMPGAVAMQGLCSAVLPLEEIASHILHIAQHK